MSSRPAVVNPRHVYGIAAGPRRCHGAATRRGALDEISPRARPIGPTGPDRRPQGLLDARATLVDGANPFVWYDLRRCRRIPQLSANAAPLIARPRLCRLGCLLPVELARSLSGSEFPPTGPGTSGSARVVRATDLMGRESDVVLGVVCTPPKGVFRRHISTRFSGVVQRPHFTCHQKHPIRTHIQPKNLSVMYLYMTAYRCFLMTSVECVILKVISRHLSSNRPKRRHPRWSHSGPIFAILGVPRPTK